MARPPHVGRLPKHIKTCPFPQPKPAHLESVKVPAPPHLPTEEALNERRQTNEEQQVLDAGLPLTQADLPRIIEVVSTFLSMQLQHPPTTVPEDTSTPDNESEHHLGA